MTISNIVVGTDESAEAAAAASWAASVARAHGAQLEFFEAVPGSAEQSPERTEEIRAATRSRIADWLHPLEFSMAPTIVVEHGDATLLTARVLLTSPDLVVVGSLPEEGTSRLALGSVVHALARQVASPVVTVPVGAVAPDGGWIVVGVDGSDASRMALRWAEELAQPLMARVCAVYAFGDVYETFSPNGDLGHDEPGAQSEVRAEAKRSNVDFVERSAAHPADALGAVAAERSASLIVVAARQRGSIGGLMLGATPDRLIHRPPCPVAVLPHEYLVKQSATATRRESVQA
jgi:nucleotide-binding universal stress UspA family protein